MKRLLPLVALAGVFALVWSLQEISGPGGVRPTRHNLVFISLDGLRADHLSMYGYPRETTSGLDKLAPSAVRFSTALSQSPDSLESHASIFTGAVPSVHGTSQARNQPLRDSLTTMAEELQFHDYDTAAFVDGDDLDPKWNLNQGFAKFEVVPRRYSESDVAIDKFRRKIYDVNRWLLSRDDERPFFVFFHSRVMCPPYFSPFPANKDFDPDYTDDSDRSVSLEQLAAIERGQLRATPDWIRHVIAQYDAELKTVDLYLAEWLNRLFSGGGFAENTIFVLTGAHGTELYDHGLVGTNKHVLAESSLQVPLLFWVPGLEGRVVDCQVRLIDIMPTLYELMGVDATDPMQGESLVTRMLGSEWRELPAFSETYRTTYDIYSLRDGDHRIVWDRRLNEKLLFDLSVDPDLSMNLSYEQPEALERLSQRLDEHLSANASFVKEHPELP